MAVPECPPLQEARLSSHLEFARKQDAQAPASELRAQLKADRRKLQEVDSRAQDVKEQASPVELCRAFRARKILSTEG